MSLGGSYQTQLWAVGSISLISTYLLCDLLAAVKMRGQALVKSQRQAPSLICKFLFFDLRCSLLKHLKKTCSRGGKMLHVSF